METVASTVMKATVLTKCNIFAFILFNADVYNCSFYKFLVEFLKKKCLFYGCNPFKMHASFSR